MNRSEVLVAWRAFVNGWPVPPAQRAATLAELRRLAGDDLVKPSLRRAARRALEAAEGPPEGAEGAPPP